MFEREQLNLLVISFVLHNVQREEMIEVFEQYVNTIVDQSRRKD